MTQNLLNTQHIRSQTRYMASVGSRAQNQEKQSMIYAQSSGWPAMYMARTPLKENGIWKRRAEATYGYALGLLAQLLDCARMRSCASR
eukprot:6182971-Pleurochrysis_carterae.AAC.4